MRYVNVENTLILNLFTIQALEKLFINLGKLDKGSFSIVKMSFSDGSVMTAFNYPTDFNNAKAYTFIEKMYINIRKLSVEELLKYCGNED